MAGTRGFAAVARLRERSQTQRGGGERQILPFEGGSPDALALWSQRWLEALRARNFAEGTLEERAVSLRFFCAWAADRELTRAGEITRPILEAYQIWLSRYVRPDVAATAPRKRDAGASHGSRGKPLAWSTQRQRIGRVRDFFRWLTRQNVIVHNPASELELPRPEKRLPVAGLSREEMARLLAVPDVADPLGVRDRAILEVFYSTGLRRSELCHLECPEVNAGRGTLTVRRGKGRKDRVVPLGARAGAWVARYLGEVRPRLVLDGREQALFLSGYGEAFNPDVLSRMVSAWLKRIGRKGSCHLLRHTCATHMLEGGADIRYIQQLLGHEQLETTAIYTEVTIRQLLEVHARCHPGAQLQETELAARPEAEIPA